MPDTGYWSSNSIVTVTLKDSKRIKVLSFNLRLSDECLSNTTLSHYNTLMTGAFSPQYTFSIQNIEKIKARMMRISGKYLDAMYVHFFLKKK